MELAHLDVNVLDMLQGWNEGILPTYCTALEAMSALMSIRHGEQVAGKLFNHSAYSMGMAA